MPRTAPQRLHATAQEAVVAALRETLLLSLDDLLKDSWIPLDSLLGLLLR